MKKQKEINNVCVECAALRECFIPEGHMATFNIAICDICGEEKEVAETRDYARLRYRLNISLRSMKKTLFIGDIHGNKDWEQITNFALMRFTNVVFLGDYFDSFWIRGYDQLKNLKNIIALKKRYPDKITLLLGNHDYAYMWNYFHTSGFNVAFLYDFREVLKDNWDLFDIAWGYKGEKYHLATHAGLTKYFYKKLVKEIENPKTVIHDIFKEIEKTENKKWHELPLHELLNYFKDKPSVLWKIGMMRGGSSPSGSILWADKFELLQDPYEGIDQIVGHTPSNYPEARKVKFDNLYFIDSWQGRGVSSMLIEM